MTSTWLSLFFGTFALEDVALVSAVLLVSKGQITLTQGFSAAFLGISVGDLILYLVGSLARFYQPLAQSRFFSKVRNAVNRSGTQSVLTTSILISRFVPGTRLVTYLLSGFLNYPFLKFVVLTIASVFVWVGLAFGIGESLREFLAAHFMISFLGLFLVFSALKNLILQLSDRWPRKAYLPSLRRWLSFEFWPAWLFYLPIIPRYIYLSIKERSFFLPFYANPVILHAGLVGESKWDFYKYFAQDDFALKTELISFSPQLLSEIQARLQKNQLRFPFILKPDQGQRGYGVRLIRSEADLVNYVNHCQFNVLTQEYCDWPCEAGIFYYRLPNEKRGHIFSITDKKFPFVLGDGKTALGDLILRDSRARIIATTYFERFKTELDSVPAKDQKVILSTCGNHAQGAIFKNGAFLQTEKLEAAVQALAEQVPHFYFGRFDIRYRSPEELKEGLHFKIVELNGAGSEATHIWDPETHLIEAYRVLFQQWGLLFEIGRQVKEKKLILNSVHFYRFLSDLIDMQQHDKNLSVSS